MYFLFKSNDQKKKLKCFIVSMMMSSTLSEVLLSSLSLSSRCSPTLAEKCWISSSHARVLVYGQEGTQHLDSTARGGTWWHHPVRSRLKYFPLLETHPPFVPVLKLEKLRIDSRQLCDHKKTNATFTRVKFMKLLAKFLQLENITLNFP